MATVKNVTPGAAPEEAAPPAATSANLPAPQTETPKETSIEVMRLQNERALEEFDDPFSSAAAYRHFKTIAELFASSQFIPQHFKGQVGDCLIGINMAKRMGEDPLMVLQNMFVVKGTPGFKTQFMIARANRLAGFQSSILWDLADLEPKTLPSGGVEYLNVRATAWAISKHGQKIEATVDTAMAIAEGWVSNAKYKSMLRHMLMWRSAAFLIRLYAPEVMMGFSTIEEVEDVALANATAAGLVAPGGRTGALLDRLTAGDDFATAAAKPSTAAGSVPPAGEPTPGPIPGSAPTDGGAAVGGSLFGNSPAGK